MLVNLLALIGTGTLVMFIIGLTCAVFHTIREKSCVYFIFNGSLIDVSTDDLVVLQNRIDNEVCSRMSKAIKKG